MDDANESSSDTAQTLVIVWVDLRPSTESSVCVCSGTTYCVRAFKTDEELDAFLKTRPRGSFFAIADASQALRSKLPGPAVVDLERRFARPKDMFDELRPEECVELVDALDEDEDVSASVPLPPTGMYYSCDEGKALFAEILDAKSVWVDLTPPSVMFRVIFPKLSRFRSVMTKPKPACALDSLQKMCDYVCDFVRVMTRIKEWMQAVPKDWPRVDCAAILAKYPKHVIDHAAKPKTKNGQSTGYAAFPPDIVSTSSGEGYASIPADDFVLYREWCTWVDVTERLRVSVDWRVLGRHDLAGFARERIKATLTEDGPFELTKLRWFPPSKDCEPKWINFSAPSSMRTAVITGPNEIGKTTAVSAIVTAVRMARVGIPINADVARVPARGEMRFLDDCHASLKAEGEELFPSGAPDDFIFVVSHDARAMLAAIHTRNRNEIAFYKMETRGNLVKGIWVYDANKRTRFQELIDPGLASLPV